MMKKYVIERDVPGIGSKNLIQLGKAAMVSNEALAKLDGIQWQHSYVAGDKTFCVYLAGNEEMIREHAKLSGFPANKITEIMTVFDPSTEKHYAMASVKSAA